jgi:long-chain acyl-CoA synthetase
MSTQFASLVDLAESSFQRFGPRPLFGERHDGAWSWLTYREVAQLVEEIRGGLAGLGVRAGEHVAIVSRNGSAWAAAAYASYGLGASFVPMYEAQRPGDWEFILRDCGASVVFGRSREIVAALDVMRPRLPALRHVIALEGAADDPRSLEALRSGGRARPVAAVHPRPEDLASLVYTSGTTGHPKGVMLTHGNLVSNVTATTEVFPFLPEDVTLSFLPWAHAFGQIADLHIVLSAGSSTAINEDVRHLSEDIAEIRPTMLIAVPRIFNKLQAGVRQQIATRSHAIRALFDAGVAASIRRRRGQSLTSRERLVCWLADRFVFAKIRARLGGRLKYAISASAALSLQVAELIDALGIEVYEGYGLTETSPIVTANCPGARKLGSLGRPIPGVSVRIDETHGDRLGHGEILVYGPNVMAGYHARPEENAKAFTADGGLRTGDLGYLDADGYLFISGRIKEQYKLENGKYVMPAPLEEQLQLAPYVTNVMLYGENRAYNVALVALDEPKIRAWAATRGLSSADLAHVPAVHELISAELERLSSDFRSYERPRAFLLTTDPLTPENGMLTATLKLKRRNLLERYQAALDRLYDAPSPSNAQQRPAGDPPRPVSQPV